MAYPNSEGYFQQDNASCNCAGIVQIWSRNMRVYFVLVNSCNPIEQLRDLVNSFQTFKSTIIHFRNI